MTDHNTIDLGPDDDASVPALAKRIAFLAGAHDEVRVTDGDALDVTVRVARTQNGTAYVLRATDGRHLGTYADFVAMLRACALPTPTEA